MKPRNQWNPYPPETVAKCRELYEGGMTTTQIGKELSLRSQTVRGLLVRNGVQMRTRGESMRLLYSRGLIKRDLPRGADHPSWKGGIAICEGYQAVRVPRGRRAYYAMHRLVMEAKLGRKLRSDEIVHHINGNKLDNRRENLQLMTRAEHARHHAHI